MKTKIIITGILFGVMSISAQVKLYVEGGLNLAGITYSGVLENGPNGQRTGGILGSGFEFYTTKGFSIQLGIRYIQKGCTYSNSTVEIVERIDYLELPFEMNLKFRLGRFMPFISAGFYYSSRISGTQIQKYNTGESYQYDMNELYDNSDLGGLAGIGLEFKLSKKLNLFLSSAYSMGLINNLTEPRLGDACNKGILLLSGIKIDL